ncbi:Mu transposase domain-containing protein, partial [Oceanobacillus locisalsi]
DKPNVEGNVGHISTWIIASLRKEKFFSLPELNKAIWEKLKIVNTRDFQKKRGNRQEAFLKEEKFALIPLPRSPFEMACWKQIIVQPDYHIKIDKHFYSVPYDYIKCVVDVRITRNIIEVFYKNIRIASHKRIIGGSNEFITLPDHMPRDHRKYAEFDKAFILDWGAGVGTSALLVIERIIESYPTEKQGLKATYSLMKLADKYSIERIERACERVLSYTARPKIKSIQTILKTGHDKLPFDDQKNQSSKRDTKTSYGFTRGAAYYGGKDNDNR